MTVLTEHNGVDTLVTYWCSLLLGLAQNALRAGLSAQTRDASMLEKTNPSVKIEAEL